MRISKPFSNISASLWRKRMSLKRMMSVFLVLASAGLVFVPMGCKKAPPVTLTAAAAPPAVYPGEPVTVTATPGALSTKKHVSVLYNWSGDAVTGNGTTATVATSTLAPGTYTVKATVKEGKAGKEGLKPGQSAEASASYTVKAFEPPTVSITANPSTIKPGETSTIAATGKSPQNRPLTYGYSATSGTVSGTADTATFNSTGAPTGTVTITGTVTDDKGQTASATTTVTVLAPYVPPVPHTQALATINFGKDKKRPTRVDNEDKANLDSLALTLQKDPDAKLVLVGEASTAEKTPKKGHKHAKVADLAAERAVNVKDYLVKDKGIDASRISVATGTADSKTVETYLVPSGANFAADVQGTTAVDEALVKPQPRKALTAKKHHKKAEK
jgi:outer membrane protein OmpA-like peptidoglycan-associated protein